MEKINKDEDRFYGENINKTIGRINLWTDDREILPTTYIDVLGKSYNPPSERCCNFLSAEVLEVNYNTQVYA